MTERAAAILGIAIIVAVGLYLYFSPYQQCVRDLAGEMKQPDPAGTAFDTSGLKPLKTDCEFLGVGCTEPVYKNPAADCLAYMSRR